MAAKQTQKPKSIRQAVKGLQRRENAVIADAEISDDDKRVVTLSLASEAPYLRWFGFEILDCAPESVDLSRFPSGIPLLRNHEANQHIGTIDEITVDADKVVRAKVRFSTVGAAADAYTMVKERILRCVSVGYEINDIAMESESDDVATYRVSNWTILEVSLVAIPADPNVGVGRSASDMSAAQVKKLMSLLQAKRAKEDEETADEEETNEETTAASDEDTSTETESEPESTEADEEDEEDKERSTAAATEEKRVADITAAGRATKENELAREFIAAKRSVDEFKKAVLHKQKAPAVHIKKEDKMTNQEQFAQVLRHVCEGKGPANGVVADLMAETQEKFPELHARSVGVSKGGVLLPGRFLQRDYGLTGPSGTGVGSVQGAVINQQTGPVIEHNFNADILGNLGVQRFKISNGAILSLPRDMVAEMTFGHGERTVAPEHNDTLEYVKFEPHRFTVQSKFTTMSLLMSGLDLIPHVQRKMAIAYDLGVQKYYFGDGFGNPDAPVGLSGLGINSATSAYAAARNTLIDAISDVTVQNAPVAKLAMNSKTIWELAKIPVGQNGQFLAEPFMGSFVVLGLHAEISNSIPDGEIWLGDFTESAVVEYNAMAIYADQDYASGKRMLILEGFLDVGAMKEELLTLVKLT